MDTATYAPRPTDGDWIAIFSASAAFVAMKADGAMTAFGDRRYGGELPTTGLESVVAIIGNSNAFVAITNESSLVSARSTETH